MRQYREVRWSGAALAVFLWGSSLSASQLEKDFSVIAELLAPTEKRPSPREVEFLGDTRGTAVFLLIPNPPGAERVNLRLTVAPPQGSFKVPAERLPGVGTWNSFVGWFDFKHLYRGVVEAATALLTERHDLVVRSYEELWGLVLRLQGQGFSLRVEEVDREAGEYYRAVYHGEHLDFLLSLHAEDTYRLILVLRRAGKARTALAWKVRLHPQYHLDLLRLHQRYDHYFKEFRHKQATTGAFYHQLSGGERRCERLGTMVSVTEEVQAAVRRYGQGVPELLTELCTQPPPSVPGREGGSGK